jgi:endonuclease III
LLPQPPLDPFQFLLWELLSDEALPARRDLAWQALRRIPALTPDSIFRTPLKTLNAAIGLIGPHRDERVEQVRALAGEFKRHHDAFKADALGRSLNAATRVFRRLAVLPRETTDRAVLFAAGYPVLPLDDATARVVARIEGTAIPVSGGAEGFTLKRARWAAALRRQRRRARRTLRQVLPPDSATYREAMLYLRHHALHTCVAVGPHCGICPLAANCASATPRKHEVRD